MTERTPITDEEIDAEKTPAGGLTAATLRKWGVSWPPPKGWRKTILQHGYPYDESLNAEGERKGDPDQLLRKVVLAVVEAGQAHILYDMPEVLAFFGAVIPTPLELADLHNVDPRIMEAAQKSHPLPTQEEAI